MSTPKPESAKPARRVMTVKLGEMEEAPRGKGAAKSLRKTLRKALCKTNSGPYGTTNSSQREYKLKS